MSVRDQMDCTHRWVNTPGNPLACGDCGEVWPGIDDWPPPTHSRNPGYGALDARWSRRIDAMLTELDEVA